MQIISNYTPARPRKRLFPGFCAVIMVLFIYGSAAAQSSSLVVHIAKIEVDPARLEGFNAALKEHAEKAVGVEPGVLTLYGVAETNNPAHITVFEVYADSAAYKKHLQSAHFKKYKRVTQSMVRSLELIPCNAIVLASKSK